MQNYLLRFKNEELIKQLQEEKQSAEQASAAKTRFLASASHDLRQPLQAQEMFIGILDEHCGTCDGKRFINNLKQASGSLSELLAALLDISKLDAGITEPNQQSIPLQEVFDRLATEQTPNAERQGLRLRILPTGRVVRTDPTLLYELLGNLLGNAVKYTRRGWILVACRPHPTDSRLIDIEVRDSGIGIPHEERERVSKSSTSWTTGNVTAKRGLGLGLSIVRRIANLLDIKVSLCDRHHRGSRFIVTTPLGSAPMPLPAQPAKPEPLPPMTILVIDNDMLVHRAMADILAHWGHRPLPPTVRKAPSPYANRSRRRPT